MSVATETISDKELILAGALAAANQARDKMGLPFVDHLYPGVVKDEQACAITMTVYDDDVDRKDYWIETAGEISVYRRLRDDGPEEDWDIELPPIAKIPLDHYATKFVEMFDKGEFPDLIIDKHPWYHK